MPDRGPIYTETLLHDQTASPSWIVEPYNAATAALFIIVAVYWLVRLAGRRQTFLTYAASVLAVGGVGGTLYHALRSHAVFLALDVVPIFVLAVSAVYWFVHRMTHARWAAPLYTVGGLFLIVGVVRLVGGAGHGRLRGPLLGYGMLGMFVIVPMLVFVVRTRFRDAQWVALAVGAFAAGLWFRAIDRSGLLPMGTHFLWHTLGALMTHLLLLYLWRVRDVQVASAPGRRDDVHSAG